MFDVASFSSWYPNNDTEDDKSAYWVNEKPISRQDRWVINLDIKNWARPQEFPEEGDSKDNPGVAKTTTQSIQNWVPGLITHSKSFKTAHYDAVGNNQSNKGPQNFKHLVIIGFQYLTYQGYEGRNYPKLDNNPYTTRD